MDSNRLISRLTELNWDFEGAKSESTFSGVHWHPCRYVSQIPAALIGLLTKPSGILLDPFLGSGTTAVEAQRLARRFIGYEINPVAAMMSFGKVLPFSAQRISKIVSALKSGALESIGQARHYSSAALCMPPDVQAEKWYVPSVASDLAVLWGDIQKYRRTPRVIATLAFSSILLKVCRETRHWGYVCDNTSPIGNRGGNVLMEYVKSLDAIAEAYQERDVHLKDFGFLIERCKIVCGDARSSLSNIQEKSIDLIVTSPPYFGVSDYAKSQRLTAEWFGTNIESIRLAEIGARSKRHRRAAYEEYMSDLGIVFKHCFNALKTGSRCCVVIGESSARSGYIGDFKSRMIEIGYALEHEATRRISVRRRQNPSLHEEHLLIFRRTQ